MAYVPGASGSGAIGLDSATYLRPAEAVVGDLLIMVLSHTNNVSLPTGWTILENVTNHKIGYRTDDGTASWTVGPGATNHAQSGGIIVVREFDPSVLVADIVTSTGPESGTLNNVHVGALVIGTWGRTGSSDPFGLPPDGMNNNLFEWHNYTDTIATRLYGHHEDVSPGGDVTKSRGTAPAEARNFLLWIPDANDPKTTSDLGAISATDTQDTIAMPSLSESGTFSSSETSSSDVTVDSIEPGTISSTDTPEIDSTLDGGIDAGNISSVDAHDLTQGYDSADSGTTSSVDSWELMEGYDSIDSSSITGIDRLDNLLITGTTPLQRIRVDIYDHLGAKQGAGPMVDILQANYDMSLDEIGQFTLSVPATDEYASILQSGQIVHVTREGEGLVYKGFIEHPEWTINEDGEQTLTVRGDSLGRKLVYQNTLLGRQYSGSTPSTVVNDLLTGSGWTLGTIGDATGKLFTGRFDGTSTWSALRHVAQMMGWHIRENMLTNTVDLVPGGSDSGIVVRNIDHIPVGNLAVVPLNSIRIVNSQEELWNRIIPLGAGEGANVLTLRHSDRTAPYAIKTMTGPDGSALYYIEDNNSITQYDTRTKVLKIDDVAPISNSTAEIRKAANALYDLAAAWLGWHSNQIESYEIGIVGLRHLDSNGQPQFRVGDTLRLQYRGLVENDHGRYVWKDVDSNVYIMRASRTFAVDGSDRWSIVVSTVDQLPEHDPIAKALEDMWSVRTSLRPYTYREVHGPQRDSLDASNPLIMSANFDANITYLHRADLTVQVYPVRSNVRASAQGSAHSHSISGQTASSGGGATSSSGSPHDHTISGQATQEEGDWDIWDSGHRHRAFGPLNTQLAAWTNPPYRLPVTFLTEEALNKPVVEYVVEIGRASSDDYTFVTTWGGGEHTHPLEGITSNAEGTHTHDVPNHTHNVTATTSSAESSHTHEMVYGIFQGPTPATPGIRIKINGTDVTSALGGPWNTSFNVDITDYLVDGDGQVLRQNNTIEFTTSELCDIEGVVKSLVSAMSLIPV